MLDLYFLTQKIFISGKIKIKYYLNAKFSRCPIQIIKKSVIVKF